MGPTNFYTTEFNYCRIISSYALLVCQEIVLFLTRIPRQVLEVLVDNWGKARGRVWILQLIISQGVGL